MEKKLVRVVTPVLPAGARVVVCGSSADLGAWQPAQGAAMASSGIPVWSAEIPADAEYKFVVLHPDGSVQWEEGENRTPTHSGPLQFRGLPLWRAAGVAIPVFSLRSADDYGVGEFLDLKLMVDWAVATGQSLIQILPINDTTTSGTNGDSYPYSAISTFALHPLYLRVQEVGTLASADDMEAYAREAERLNALDKLDYAGAFALKMSYLRELFAQQRVRTLRSEEFLRFMVRNSRWLLPYAAFCVLRDRYRTADPSRWERFAQYDPVFPALLLSEEPREMEFVFFLQYHLDRQLRAVRDYAHSRGVALKGDIPIGISRHSADAWVNPELFHLDTQAGAPPDDFAALGQNWGFPTYNWPRMAEDGYAWWRERFSKMADYFDAYRIDHVLGFFRIWSIPMEFRNGLHGHFEPALPLSPEEMHSRWGFRFDPAMLAEGPDGVDDVLFLPDPAQPGLYHPRIDGAKTTHYLALDPDQQWRFRELYEDFFYRRHNDFWASEALLKLPALTQAAPMLPCAEDLGMIPACVPSVLNQLQILALEVQRMPKEYGVPFGVPSRYPWLSVCTTSTHDMSGIRGWWTEDRERTQLFYNTVLGFEGEAPREATPDVCRLILEQHMQSPAMLAVIPLQDWLSIDPALRRDDPAAEQINVPADPHHYWCYRMHLPLEHLLAAPQLNASLTALTKCR